MQKSQSVNNIGVSVFGLGYVGCVSMGCIAQAGHRVIGVDVNESKVSQINDGIATIFEPGLDDLIRNAHTNGKISATKNVEEAILNSTVSLITVGTPSRPDGELDLSHIFIVAEAIGIALKKVDRYHSIAIRSTVRPGTCQRVMDIIAKASGKEPYEEFTVVANPEFLREGSAIKDYMNPPYILIGSDDHRGVNEVAYIYSGVNAETVRVSMSAAEIIKSVNNSWHAVKVAFGNEVGAICKTLNINSQEVMDIFVKDESLNVSAAYLRPGFAFGGSCLPKDLAGFASLAKINLLTVPLLNNVKASNEHHIERAVELIKAQGMKKIGFFGIAFKEGTDDVRNSPALKVIQALSNDGYDVRIWDNDVFTSIKSNRNKEMLTHILGPIADLIVETQNELLEHAEFIVVAKKDKSFEQTLLALNGRPLVDLVYMGDNIRSQDGYVGLAW